MSPVRYLGFSSKGCHVADLLRPQRVDDGALSHIGIANETYTYLLLVCVELWEAKYKQSSACRQLREGSNSR